MKEYVVSLTVLAAFVRSNGKEFAMKPETSIAICTRLSSRTSAPESCANQERLIRAALTEWGIDRAAAVVIREDASGQRGAPGSSVADQ